VICREIARLEFILGFCKTQRMFRWFEYAQVFHPSKVWEIPAADLGRPFEDLTLTAADGVRLSAWFFPADETSPRRNMALLVCHGNGGNISHRLPLAGALLGLGVNVLLFDYRGYGHSEGALSEEGTYLDAQAAYGWLRQRGFSQIIALGESLGGGIASELALRESVAGLILSSTFTSIGDIGAEMFPWLPIRWFNSIHYDTMAKLPRIRVPVLVMHSRGDEVIRYRHAERNFAAANEPKLFLEIRGLHNESLALDPALYLGGVEKLLALAEPAVPCK
jgi:pimeloyl-ACP methyl ester carboxylesterase